MEINLGALGVSENNQTAAAFSKRARILRMGLAARHSSLLMHGLGQISYSHCLIVSVQQRQDFLFIYLFLPSFIMGVYED